MNKFRHIILWISSIILLLLALDGFLFMPSSIGLLFCIVPAILLNPITSKLVETKIVKINKKIKLVLMLSPIVTTLIFIVAFSSATSDPIKASSQLSGNNDLAGVTSSQVVSESSNQNSSSEISSTVASSTVASSTATSSTVASSSSQTTTNVTTTNGKKLKVHYLDVGQGDSEFIELPNKKTILIDAGVAERGSGIVSYIKKLGYSKIDYIICTHPHSDHIGGMPEVINSFDVGEIYMPQTSESDTPTTQVYRNLLTAIKNKNITTHRATSGVKLLNENNISANLIAPCGTNYNDLNQYSAVLMLQYGNNKFLFMGDTGTVSENEITSDVKADVLKVGHHGSKTSTGTAFLNKVNPKYAVIEVGKDNTYGHPTEQCLSRLQAIGASIYRTDQSGTIIFTSDGNTITVDKNASSINANAPNTSSVSTTSSTTASSSASTTSSASASSTVTSSSKASSSTVTAAPSSSNDNQIVYITKSGKCYHMDGCSSLSKSKIQTTLGEAKAKGYKPCEKCNPPE